MNKINIFIGLFVFSVSFIVFAGFVFAQGECSEALCLPATDGGLSALCSDPINKCNVTTCGSSQCNCRSNPLQCSGCIWCRQPGQICDLCSKCTKNNWPIVDAGPDKKILEGREISIEGSASDPDGDAMTYSWSCEGLNFPEANTLVVRDNAPAVIGDQVFTCTLTVSDGRGGTASDSVKIKVIDSTLSVSLEADPKSGQAPLRNVSLTAKILPQSTADGATANYTFWCNCSYTGTDVIVAKSLCGDWAIKAENANPSSYKADKACNYFDSAGGRVIPKVIVEKGLASAAQAQAIPIIIGKNDKPRVSDLSMNPSTGCTNDCNSCLSRNAIISWKFNDSLGDYQSAFEVLISREFVDPVTGTKTRSIKRDSEDQIFTIPSEYLPVGAGKVTWGIRVFDSGGLASSWVFYDGYYQTPIYDYPEPNFSFSPDPIKLNVDDVQFVDESRVFGGATVVQRQWAFPNGSLAGPGERAEQNPLIVIEDSPESSEGPEILFYAKPQKVKLKIIDSSGLFCEIEKPIKSSSILPKWREIFPF